MTEPEVLEWMRSGEAAVARAVAELDDAAMREPSRLPDWTRGHVLTHLARNADALGNLLDWGRTGAEHPMYPSRASRAGDIEAGADRPAAEMRADLHTASGRLAADLDSYPDDRWSYPVRGSATGRVLEVREVPWLRVREVWLHLIDLDVGAELTELPDGVLERLCTENLAYYASRDDAPAATVTFLPSGAQTRLGGGGPAVRGSARELAGWLTGRADLPGAPDLPPWL